MNDLAAPDAALCGTEDLTDPIFEAGDEVFSDQPWSDFIKDLSLRYFEKDALLVAHPPVASS